MEPVSRFEKKMRHLNGNAYIFNMYHIYLVIVFSLRMLYHGLLVGFKLFCWIRNKEIFSIEH